MLRQQSFNVCLQDSKNKFYLCIHKLFSMLKDAIFLHWAFVSVLKDVKNPSESIAWLMLDILEPSFLSCFGLSRFPLTTLNVLLPTMDVRKCSLALYT